ncbi:zinc permease [Candidatus Woesebacteria bacterium RBG_13_34_9]|uniref:Zinc permease n=1 Tax=Candidatus Woesebacteria bacterium RBG_13_34_9 TaxID=1802477 RepID=A0A1F7X206_9BACT|nr:MAG: zinc permease [Candidatus Woesebacteria bacterium RBG_13_34_9]
MSNYLAILVLAILSGLTTLIGVALAIYFNKSIRLITTGLGFAAGIMLCISIFELLPESFNAIGLGKCVTGFILGIITIISINFIIPHHHFRDEESKLKIRLLRTSYLCALGLIIHDFPEGFAMANSFIHSPQLGLLVASGIALHNIPEEFSIAVPIILAKKKKGYLFKMAFLSGLAEPVGAIIGIFAASIVPKLTPFFLSFSAGAMVFISLHELIPTAKIYRKNIQLFGGILLSLLVYLGLTILFPQT